MHAVQSSSARSRIRAARAFIGRFPPDTELLIVAATRGAADDFARTIAVDRATFGLHRFSLTELAARAAAFEISVAGQVPGTSANAEAMAARATFDAHRAGELTYFTPVAEMPGFPRALARTLHELRLATVGPISLDPGGASTRHPQGDLGRLLERVDAQLRSAAVTDRAALFETAAHAWPAAHWAGYPVLLLDVPLASTAERRFALSVCRHATAALATVATGDEATLLTFASEGVPAESIEDDADASADLGRLRRHIFALEPPPGRIRTGDVRLFSAPGEAREAIEIARRFSAQESPQFINGILDSIKKELEH